MNFPLNAFHELGLDGSLLVYLVIGFGFGFALERGGFGSSKVLAGIFYFKDWRVLKVMFTAIVTAMLGLYLAEGAGLVVMDQLAFRSTYIYGQVVGGLILGVGFVVAGYCPGTSIVGAVSGKLDAIFVLVGVVLGIGVFEENYALLKDFYMAGYMGELSIAAWSGLPQGLVVLAVVLVALAAFWATERFGTGGQLKGRRDGNLLRGAGLTLTAAVGVAIVQLAGPGQSRPIETGSRADGFLLPSVEVLDLAGWVVEGRPDLLVLDVRLPDSGQQAVPGSLSLSPAALLDYRQRPELPTDRVLLVVDDEGAEPASSIVRSLRGSGYDAVLLSGGGARWTSQVLANGTASSDPRAAALRLLVSGKSAFEGAAPPPPPNPSAAPPPRKKKKGGGC